MAVIEASKFAQQVLAVLGIDAQYCTKLAFGPLERGKALTIQLTRVVKAEEADDILHLLENYLVVPMPTAEPVATGGN